MTQLKLTYFNAAGRAELARLLFVIGGISFEDARLDGPAFGALKPTLPLGQVPVLEVDGVVYPQSMAIARYAARVAGLYPNDALDSLKVEAAIESLLELQSLLIDILFVIKDEAIKAEKKKTLFESTAPKVFNMIEKQVQGKTFLGDKLSFVDVALYNSVVNGLTVAFPDFNVNGYPKIKSIIDSVAAHPNVVAHNAKHK